MPHRPDPAAPSAALRLMRGVTNGACAAGTPAAAHCRYRARMRWLRTRAPATLRERISRELDSRLGVSAGADDAGAALVSLLAFTG